ncbi:hypothetical protein KAFR_0A04310 [Kazachstania africana CBS 2517]|uniref:Uncharacterized protein n=1 Tax=Kazachstania africana (strain ATCC 22294 / BCRC 22015 / CBS 2517 / CECT 1963 / NBRC 1671 / NRRL Y-8276) TaxID=1071382 RepID=H2ANB6_KAZAF|nr:hypothetical protein KAFR_0A04310 [Kazachstania africana CBS 2517]CCF55866.1 hypothetical protein KAFR_0A04310 [Kazachstania africana CBS 2517]
MPLQLFGRDQIVVHYDSSNEDIESHDDSSPSLSRTVVLQYKLLHFAEDITQFKLYNVTIVHWTLFLLWLWLLWSLTNVYNDLYQRSAHFASMCTNVILFGLSDIIAQSITCYFSSSIDPIPQIIDSTANEFMHQWRHNASPSQNNEDTGYESDNYSVFNDYGLSAISSNVSDFEFNTEYSKLRDTSIFNFWRWVCFMFWGLFISNFQVPWYKILNYFYTEDPTVIQVLERVLSDQLLYSPLFLYFFFTYSNFIMERGDSETYRIKIERLYISTLGCNLLVWPLAQFINFLIIPKHFQVPFSSSVGVLWNCFLSMRNASNSI